MREQRRKDAAARATKYARQEHERKVADELSAVLRDIGGGK